MKQPALLNSQFFAQLATSDKTTTRTTQLQRAYWWHAIVIGSIAQVSLFAALPLLAPGRVSEEFDRPIEVNFVAWQTPKAATKPDVKPRRQAPKIKPKVKPKPKAVIEPQPAPTPPPQPSLDAEKTQETPPQTTEVSNSKAVPTQTPTEPVTPALESLPMPIPEYMLSEYPSYAHEDPGSYPFEMRSLGREAVVGLDILIDKNGKVRNIKITQSQGALFDQAAIDKINRSSFLPGKSDGKPVVVLLHEKVTFKLK